MLELKLMKIFKKFCQEQSLDYYETLLFAEKQLKAKEVLLRRNLDNIELSKEMDMVTKYLSEFGEKEGLKVNNRDFKENNDFDQEISTVDVLNIIKETKGELDLF